MINETSKFHKLASIGNKQLFRLLDKKHSQDVGIRKLSHSRGPISPNSKDDRILNHHKTNSKRVLNLSESVNSITPICDSKMRSNIDKIFKTGSDIQKFKSIDSSIEYKNMPVAQAIFTNHSKVYSGSEEFKNAIHNSK